MDDYKSSYLSRLPYEVYCFIFKLLSREEKIALKFAYIGQHTNINVKESFSLNKENILNMLQLHPNPNVITKLDFSFCYWVPTKELTKFAKQCKNLTELAVAHSTIDSHHLEEIICENVHITKLCFSINVSEGFDQNAKLVNYYLHQTAGWEDPLFFLHLGKCRKILAQLETLQLHVGEYPIIIATLITACTSLQNLTLKLDVAEKYQSLQNRTNTSKAIATIFQTDSLEPSEYWSHFNVTKTLKSFVLQHSGNNSVCLDEQMTQFIQKIIKTSNRNLRCFWTSIPTLEVDKSIFDWKAMIAWNHSEITSNLPSIESYVGNLFPEHNAPYGDLIGPSKVKQIECTSIISTLFRAHPYLERVRLNKHGQQNQPKLIADGVQIPVETKRIKILSLHPTVIKEFNGKDIDTPFLNLFTAYHSLEELDISPDVAELTKKRYTRECLDGIIYWIASNALSKLKACNYLKKFSISYISIRFSQLNYQAPSFLEDIVIKCPNLEALHLQNLKLIFHQLEASEDERLAELQDSFFKRLYVALESARKLRFFRLKLSVDNDVRGFQTIVEMIRSINCPSLVQLELVFTSNKMRRTTLPLLSGSYGYICVGRESYNNDWEEAQFTTLFIDLVQRLPKLVTLLVVFPSATTSQCKAATAIVES